MAASYRLGPTGIMRIRTGPGIVVVQVGQELVISLDDTTLITVERLQARTDLAVGQDLTASRDVLAGRHLRTADGSFLLRTGATLANGAGAALGTLLNAPAIGNPTKWVPLDDNGVTRFLPAW
jgi:hypothetical protein